MSVGERGLLLQRYSRVPAWMGWVVLVLVLIIAEPVGRSWMSGHLELPRWLESQFGVLLMLALVLAVVALVTSILKQLLSELFGGAYVGALYAKGLVVRRRLGEHFVPWEAIRGIRQQVMHTQTTTQTGATTNGPTFVFYEIDCGEGPLVLLRDTEGGTETANLISARAGLEWRGDCAVRG